MRDQYSKQALLREIEKLQRRLQQQDELLNSLVALKGEVTITQAQHEAAQQGRTSIQFDPAKAAIVLRYHGPRPPGTFAKLVALVGGASIASKRDD